jgi:hypothetical protein
VRIDASLPLSRDLLHVSSGLLRALDSSRYNVAWSDMQKTLRATLLAIAILAACEDDPDDTDRSGIVGAHESAGRSGAGGKVSNAAGKAGSSARAGSGGEDSDKDAG